MRKRPNLPGGVPFLDLTKDPKIPCDPKNPDAEVNQTAEATGEFVKGILRDAYARGGNSVHIQSMEDELMEMETERTLLNKVLTTPDELTHEELLYLEWLQPILKARLKNTREIIDSEWLNEFVAHIPAGKGRGEALNKEREKATREAEYLEQAITSIQAILIKNGIDSDKGRTPKELIIEAVDTLLAGEDRISETTLRGIGQKTEIDPETVFEQLVRIYQHPSSDERRKNIALFEIAKHCGRQGVDFIAKLIKEIPEDKLRTMVKDYKDYDPGEFFFEALAENGSPQALGVLDSYMNIITDRLKFIILNNLVKHAGREEVKKFFLKNFIKMEETTNIPFLLSNMCGKEQQQSFTPSLLQEMYARTPSREVKDRILSLMVSYRLYGTKDFICAEVEHIEDQRIKEEVKKAIGRI